MKLAVWGVADNMVSPVQTRALVKSLAFYYDNYGETIEGYKLQRLYEKALRIFEHQIDESATYKIYMRNEEHVLTIKQR